MSTVNHTATQTLRHPSSRQFSVAALVLLVTAAAITIVLIVSTGGSSVGTTVGGPGTGVQHGTPQQELQALSGARFGVTRMLPPEVSGSAAAAVRSNSEATNASPRYQLPGRAGQGNRLGAKLR